MGSGEEEKFKLDYLEYYFNINNKYKNSIQILYLIIMTIFSIIIIIYGINFANTMKSQISPSIKISMWWFYIAFSVSSIFILLYIVEELLKIIKDIFL